MKIETYFVLSKGLLILWLTGSYTTHLELTLKMRRETQGGEQPPDIILLAAVRRWIKKHGAITMSLTLWDIEDLVCQVAESADWKRFFSAGDDLPKTDNKID